MPFLAPLIGAAIGGVAATTFGTAVIGAGVSLGLGYMARRLAPKPDNQPRGMSLNVRLESNEAREVAFGTVPVAGSRKYHHTYGPNGNDYLQLVFVLFDHECDSISGLFVDGVWCTLGSEVSTPDVTGQPVSGHTSNLWVKFHSGAWDQAADADLVAKRGDGQWPNTFRGRGVCYVRVTWKYDAEKYPTGLPAFLFVIKGAKLYDWRKDTTNGGSGAHRWGTPSTYEWSDNPFVQDYNFRRGIFVNGKRLAGMNTPAASLPVGVWTAAANACDETVSLKAGGTEKRYRSNIAFRVNEPHREVSRDIVTAAAGLMVETGGIFKPYAGVAQVPVMDMTDTDIMAREPVRYTPKLSRAALVNAVFGTFTDPAQKYEPVALPPRISPSDEAADGGIQLQEHYGLGAVQSGTQGQRVVEILRRKGRYQRRVTLRLRSRFAVLEAGDWISWTSARYGFSAMPFEVVQATLERDLTVSVELKETNGSIYSWTPSSDEIDPQAPKSVVAGGSTFTTVQSPALANVTIDGGDSATRPGLHITWTPVTDPTVVELALYYRKVGDSVALGPLKILNPGTGTHTWNTGVQGGAQYEAQLVPVTVPARAVVATAWVQAPDESAGQVVAAAILAETVPPDTITIDMLDAQARFELYLVTAIGSIQGSVQERVDAFNEQLQAFAAAQLEHRRLSSQTRSRVLVTERTIQTNAESFANYKVQTDAALLSLDGEIDGQATAVSDLTSRVTTAEGTITSQGSALTTVQGQIDHPTTGLATRASATALSGLDARVVDTEDGIEAVEARAFLGVAITGPNGVVTGGVDVYGNDTFSSIIFQSDLFAFTLPGDTDGSDARYLISGGEINGVTRVGFDADEVLFDGSVKVRHLDAIDIATLYISDPDGTYFYNFATGQQGATDGSFLIDAKNKRITATSVISADFQYTYNSMNIAVI